MRILDIGVATSYALICISLVSAMNPYPAANQASHNAADARASNAVFGYVSSVGLVFIGGAPPEQVCASLSQHSNATMVLGGTLDGETCGSPPSSPQGEYSLALSLSGRQVVIQAWALGPEQET